MYCIILVFHLAESRTSTQPSQDDMEIDTATVDDSSAKLQQQTQHNQPSKRKKQRRKIARMPPEIETDGELHKYWAQRYRLFSRYDEGVKLDRGNLLGERSRT